MAQHHDRVERVCIDALDIDASEGSSHFPGTSHSLVEEDRVVLVKACSDAITFVLKVEVTEMTEGESPQKTCRIRKKEATGGGDLILGSESCLTPPSNDLRHIIAGTPKEDRVSLQYTRQIEVYITENLEGALFTREDLVLYGDNYWGTNPPPFVNAKQLAVTNVYKIDEDSLKGGLRDILEEHR